MLVQGHHLVLRARLLLAVGRGRQPGHHQGETHFRRDLRDFRFAVSF